MNWDDAEFDDEDNVPLSELIPSTDIYNETIQETQHLLSKLAIDCTLSTDEIEDWNEDGLDENAMDNDSDRDESDTEIIQNPVVPYIDALNAVNTLIKWSENYTNLTNKHMSNLLELRSDVEKNHQANKP